MDAKALHMEAKAWYWNDKDLAAARRSLEQGIALAQVEGLKGEEKAMNYDLAAFCWHGWDEPGIVVTDDDVEAGRRAAEENLRLAQELERPAGPMGNAWWMVGAYRLQDGDYAGAREAFERFRELAGETGPTALLAKGYVELADVFLSQSSTFFGTVAELERDCGEEGDELAKQLLTAFEVFVNRGVVAGIKNSRLRIEVLDLEAIEQESEALGELLHACVLAGASVHFVLPFSLEEAQDYWRGIRGRAILVARLEDRVVGTVSLILDTPPNQAHRAEVAKLLVHPEFRQRGVARALMIELERVAREKGRTLLTLDTVSGSPADRLYRSLGYVFAGTIPDYAAATDGSTLVSTSLFFKRFLPNG